jgi:hypothetical protein
MKRAIGMLMTSRTASAFSPTSIAGLKFWVKADTLSLANNDPVPTWADQSGSGNNAAQSSGTLQPIYKTNIQNGKPIVRFDGTDDFLEVADTAIIGGESGMTAFFVTAHTTNALTKALLTKWDYSTQGTFIVSTYLGLPNRIETFIADVITDLGGNNQYTTNEILVPTTFSIISIVYDGTQSVGNRVKIYSNGGAAEATSTNGTIPTTLTSSTSKLLVGSGQGGISTWNYDGDMGEIILYNSALSDANRESVRNYLNNRWAIY